MSLSDHWLTHITAWQRSGLSQVAYCQQHQLAKSTFLARLSEFRAQVKSVSQEPLVLLPIQTQPPALPKCGIILHHKDHRLELPASVAASWLAELLRYLD